MFTRILFPTKFEEFSLEILKNISCLKSGGLEYVVLLHVIDIDKAIPVLIGVESSISRAFTKPLPNSFPPMPNTSSPKE